MIVDEVVCGYLVTPEQLAKFADEHDISYKSSSPSLRDVVLRSRTETYIEKKFRNLHPAMVAYPRLVERRKAFPEILFATRQVFDVSHKYSFTETPRDQEVLEGIMNVDPSIRAILKDSTFVTVPNPSGDILLPGEELKAINNAETKRGSAEVRLSTLTCFDTMNDIHISLERP